MGKNGSLGLGMESNFNQLLVHYGVKLILGSGSVIFYCYSVCIKEQRGKLGQHFIPTVDTSGREPFSCGSVCQRSTFLKRTKFSMIPVDIVLTMSTVQCLVEIFWLFIWDRNPL